MVLDGRFLQQEFTGEMMGHPYSGIGISGYDNLRKTLCVDMDRHDGNRSLRHGRHGERRRQDYHPEGQHDELRWRADVASCGVEACGCEHAIFEMYGTHGHGKEMKMMEITYTRKTIIRAREEWRLGDLRVGAGKK